MRLSKLAGNRYNVTFLSLHSKMGRLNARVMETAGKAFYGGKECACNGNSV